MIEVVSEEGWKLSLLRHNMQDMSYHVQPGLHAEMYSHCRTVYSSPAAPHSLTSIPPQLPDSQLESQGLLLLVCNCTAAYACVYLYD